MQSLYKTTPLLVLCVILFGSWLAGAGGQSPDSIPASPLVEAGRSSALMQVVGQPGEPITTVVYDSEQKVLGVYHIDRQSGEIELKSVRQIRWDLQMLHFQGRAPLPEDIRNGLESANGR